MFEAILREIQNHDTVILHRHSRPDGDALGSQFGLKYILQANFPNKTVYAVGDDPGNYRFIGDGILDEIPDSTYEGALAIILDTGAASLISDERYRLAAATARIDHHIFTGKITDEEVIDSTYESCCGLITEFAVECGLTLPSEAAKALYTGMITDTGRFKYSGVGGDTMRAAATLLDVGVDTDTLFARLYLEAFEYLKFKAHIYEKMQITPNGVAYIFVDREMQQRFGLNLEQSSAVIGNLDSIRGCISWIAFIESGDPEGSIRVRLRSRFVHINSVAEKYRGGGHACASGATVYGREEMEQLLADTDALVKEYKETHEGWL